MNTKISEDVEHLEYKFRIVFFYMFQRQKKTSLLLFSYRSITISCGFLRKLPTVNLEHKFLM